MTLLNDKMKIIFNNHPEWLEELKSIKITQEDFKNIKILAKKLKRKRDILFRVRDLAQKTTLLSELKLYR